MKDSALDWLEGEMHLEAAHPSGDLEAELRQLAQLESMVLAITTGPGCPSANNCTNATAVCSGGICCF